MATVTKNFKVKSGLVVEGSTATVAGYDVLKKSPADDNYIIGLIGGSATPDATPETVVLRDENADFSAGTITADLIGDVTGNADTATTLETARTIALSGDVTGSVSFDGSANVTITTTLDGDFATDAEVATAKSEAISAAATDATTKADDAQDAAEAFATQADSALYSTVTGDIATAKAAAESTASADATTKANDAKSYAETLVSTEASDRYTAITNAINTEVQDRNSAISTAVQNLGSDTTAAIATAKSEAIADANAHADAAVAALVDSAPEMLDTLNELAAAIADNPNYASDVANLVATKADTSYVNSEISDLDTAAQGYATTAQSNAESFATTAANNAQSAAEATAAQDATTKANAAKAYAEDLVSDEASDRSTAISNAISTEVSDRNNAIDQAINTEVTARNGAISSAIATEVTNRNNAITSAVDAISTSDIEEGTNQYFTTSRAKVAAANLITSATKTNIVITGDENGLTITAENGVADSTTSDLAEGSRLYFTDERAVSALEAVVPNFTAVEFNSVAKQVAVEATIATASTNNAVVWSKNEYRSAEFLVKIKNGTHTDISKVMLTLDSSDNIAITEFAMVGTNGSLGSFNATVSGNNVALTVTTDNNTSDVMVVGTLLK